MLPQILMTVKGVALLTAAVYGFAALLRKEDAAWIKGRPLAILLSMFVIGMWGHNVWVGYFALMLALPIVARSRVEAAVLYCVLTVSMPLLYTKVSIGSLYLFPADKYLFCALGLAIAFVMKRGSKPSRQTRFDIPILIIAVLEFAHSRDAGVTATVRQYGPVVVAILVPYFALSRSLNTVEDIRRFALAFALTGFVMGLIAVVEVRLHWLIYAQLQEGLHVRRAVNIYGKMRAGMIRAPASFGDSTTLGTYLAMTCMAVLALRNHFGSATKWYAALGVIVAGILAANTRGAVVAVGIGIIVQDVYNRRYGPLSVKLAVVGGAYLFAEAAAQFSPFFAAMLGKSADTQETADYRVQLLRRGLEEIHKHPILGTNLQAAMNNLEDLRQGEGIIDLVNGYISYGLTLGYMGIVGLVMVFVSLALAMLIARRQMRASPILMHIGGFIFSVAVFSIVNGFFTGFGGPSSTPFYEICALGSALWAARGLALLQQQASGTAAAVLPPTGLAALIAADRERAAQAKADDPGLARA